MNTPSLGLCLAPNASLEMAEWHNFLLCFHILQEAGGSFQWHSLDGTGRLMRVLEMDSKVGAAGLARFCCVVGSFAVMNFAHFLVFGCFFKFYLLNSAAEKFDMEKLIKDEKIFEPL